MTHLTIDDLRNPARKSGFDHVYTLDDHRPGRTQRWRGGAGDGRKDWSGHRRATPEEAAQDYCDYINGKDAAAQERTIRLAPGRPDLYAAPNGEWWRGEARNSTPASRFSDAVKRDLAKFQNKRFAFEKDVEDALVPIVRQLAEDLGRPVLCEVKNDTGRQAIATAVGQLLLRQQELRSEGEYNTFLALGVPEALRPDLHELVESLGITVLVA